ncbi:AHH domain-containing protein [Stigmatella erecta]|uniref:A nuclease family of the HNH/ENDO VII superfamily with conserved AHH n=1 Tax=Stigmatella erecta TaxID=83460 RepID=A0A1I0L169_9BACT|nr:AHH domain-containing protein [Stigmatella erecta]SEU31916.1 A nuclease family of the HNH/ENDO VII superfamily with conserved AHH [Stigmatella erecta]
MMPWRLLWSAHALFLALLTGCSSTAHRVRVEHKGGGETLLHIPHTAVRAPSVTLTSQEMTQAIRKLAREVHLTASPRETVERLFQLDPVKGDYLYLLRERKLVPLQQDLPLEGTVPEDEQKLVRRYLAWCQSAHHVRGDCLGGALVAGQYLDLQGRYMWAMALSRSPFLEEFEKALGEQVRMQAVMQAATAAAVTLLVLLAMPEPVTKFIAAWATAGLILWMGAQTLYRLITGWFELMEDVKAATTFEEIREAGETFGKRVSREAAQALALIAMALLAHGAKDFGERMAALPGSAQVSMQAASQEGLLLSEVGAVESVTVTAEGFRVALAPGAVAMAVRGGREGRTERHHIATIANLKSTLRGGPWTPRFEDLFARAGMRLNDRKNITPIQGHKGPHPQRYHDIVYERLDSALGDCRSIADCRARLLPTLEDLARDIATPGTELNRLVTLGQ